MKKIILFFSVLLLIACSKDSIFSSDPTLPPETQTGANTAGCLVNGKVFLPKGGSMFSGPTLSCFYQQNQGGYHLGLGISEDNSTENKLVNISLNPVQLVENTTYNLISKESSINNSNITNFGEFYILNNINAGKQYRTKNNLPGELKITKLNTQQRIISGTFWYDAYDINNEKVEIREGRFDMHYVN